MEIKLPRGETSEIPEEEPVRELYNYHFYHFAMSYNSIVLSNKRACHVIFFNSPFTTKKKENKKLRQSIIFFSYCFLKSENLEQF